MIDRIQKYLDYGAKVISFASKVLGLVKTDWPAFPKSEPTEGLPNEKE